jgi:hypothetical protein
MREELSSLTTVRGKLPNRLTFSIGKVSISTLLRKKIIFARQINNENHPESHQCSHELMAFLSCQLLKFY